MSKNGTEAVFVLFLSCAKLFEHVKVFFQICVCVFSRDKDLQNVSSRLMKKITTKIQLRTRSYLSWMLNYVLRDAKMSKQSK